MKELENIIHNLIQRGIHLGEARGLSHIEAIKKAESVEKDASTAIHNLVPEKKDEIDYDQSPGSEFRGGRIIGHNQAIDQTHANFDKELI